MKIFEFYKTARTLRIFGHGIFLSMICMQAWAGHLIDCTGPSDINITERINPNVEIGQVMGTTYISADFDCVNNVNHLDWSGGIRYYGPSKSALAPTAGSLAPGYTDVYVSSSSRIGFRYSGGGVSPSGSKDLGFRSGPEPVKAVWDGNKTIPGIFTSGGGFSIEIVKLENFVPMNHYEDFEISVGYDVKLNSVNWASRYYGDAFAKTDIHLHLIAQIPGAYPPGEDDDDDDITCPPFCPPPPGGGDGDGDGGGGGGGGGKTCTLSASPDNIEFGNISLSQFPNPGSVSSEIAFQILFDNCKGYDTVKYRFQPHPVASTPAPNGILPLESGGGMAEGVGVQVLNGSSGESPITFSDVDWTYNLSSRGYSLGSCPASGSGCNLSHPLRARVIRDSAGDVTPGTIQTQMQVIAEYQ